MFDSSKIASLGAVALLVAAAALGTAGGEDLIENFGTQPSKQVRVEKVVADGSNPCNINNGKFYAVPANMQALTAPRAGAAMGVSSAVYNRLPAQQNQAYRGCSAFASQVSGCNMQTPVGGSRCAVGSCTNGVNGVSFSSYPKANCAVGGGAGQLKENFSNTGADVSYNNNGKMMINGAEPSVLAPMAQGCDASSACAPAACDPNQANPVVFDRYIVANRHSRLRAQGDKIRGDLAIAPCNSGWFQVSVTPSIDLEAGALSVLGGTCNEQGQSIASLINMDSGGAVTALQGINFGTVFKDSCLVGAGNGLVVQARAS